MKEEWRLNTFKCPQMAPHGRPGDKSQGTALGKGR